MVPRATDQRAETMMLYRVIAEGVGGGEVVVATMTDQDAAETYAAALEAQGEDFIGFRGRFYVRTITY